MGRDINPLPTNDSLMCHGLSIGGNYASVVHGFSLAGW